MPMFLSLLTGCSQPVSDFTLQITPILLDSQREDLLALEPDIFVQVTYPDGNEEVWYAGTASEGAALQLEGLPPLPSGSKVALVAVTSGISTTEWSRSDAIAYGEATLDQELATGEQQVELAIPLPRVDDIGKRGTFRGKDRRLGGAMAMVPGAVYIFGGGDPETTDRLDDPNLGDPRFISSDTVLKATRTSEGWSEFVEVGKIVPFETLLGFPGNNPTLTADRRSFMAATPVTMDGKQAILVTGGRPVEFTAYFTDGWFLWDSENDELLGANHSGTLEIDRSDHLAFPLGNNKVLLYGGQTQINDGFPLVEIWDGQNRTSDYIDENQFVTTGGVNAFGTVLGTDVVICGGLRVETYSSTDHLWDPQEGCHRYAPNGRLSEIASLPLPLSGAAITALPDGGLLVSGGSDESFAELRQGGSILIGSALPADALSQIYRWDPGSNTWSEAGQLVYPRANHQMVTLSTGKVMIIGGNDQTSAYLSEYGAPVRCVEIYDPVERTSVAGTCTDVGQGAQAQVVTDGVSEIGILEGFIYDPFPTMMGGGNYGSIALIPE
jgi:hypothetical protein